MACGESVLPGRGIWLLPGYNPGTRRPKSDWFVFATNAATDFALIALLPVMEENHGPAMKHATMKKFLKFIAIGSFFSTVEEFLTVVVLRHDLPSYIFTLLILFPVFLTFVYFSSKLLDRLYAGEPARELAHYFAFGFAGLMIEWFVIGLSPWSNPDANPFLMLLFQLGMFSFWASVAFAPRLMTSPQELSRNVSRSILMFYLPCFLLIYVIGLAMPQQPPERRFWTIIPLILFGYLVVNAFFLTYFRAAFARGEIGDSP